MEKRGGILNIRDIVVPHMAEARRLLDEGHVAAVDGTDALNLTNLMTSGIYACAAGYLTSRTRGTPEVTITQTVALYAQAPISNADLEDLLNVLNEERLDVSWPTTFREFCEREQAIACRAPFVLIDGPVFTQNLMTQSAGRDLYDQMAAADQEFIGVIKGIGGAEPWTRLLGWAIDTGEAYIMDRPISVFLLDRFKTQKGIADWIPMSATQLHVRGVYQLNQKAFGFECRQEIASLALALLVADASSTLHHETPLLLETIDAQLRAASRGEAMRQKLINRLSEGQRAIKTRDERDFR
jgi:hypothetical protein